VERVVACGLSTTSRPRNVLSTTPEKTLPHRPRAISHLLFGTVAQTGRALPEHAPTILLGQPTRPTPISRVGGQIHDK